MRILIVANTYPNGSETFIRAHIEGLVRRGHDVTVCAKRADPDYVGEPIPGLAPPVYYAARSRSQAAFNTLMVCAASLLTRPARLATALGYLARNRDFAALQALSILPKLKGRAFDLVHCEFGPVGNVGLQLRDAGLVSGPVVTSFRGADISSYLRRKPHVYDALTRKGDLFLPVCAPFAERLAELDFPPERIRVYHSAIDIDRIAFEERVDAPSGKITLLGVGRFVEKKGFRYAIEVLSILKGEFPRLELRLVGDGPLRKELRAQADSLGVGDSVRMTGWLDHDAVLRELRGARVFLGTSVEAGSGDVEGIPNVIKEAMASGLPVVAFAHSGVPDLVRDGQTGFLAQERDSRTMADRVRAILSGKAGDTVRNARREIEEAWSTDGQAAEIEKIYEGAIKHGIQS